MRTKTRTRTVALAGAVVVAATAATGFGAAQARGLDSAGAALAELRGARSTAAYDTPAAAPAGLLPEWVRDVRAEVVVVRPGRSADPGARGLRADLDVGADFALPASCRPAEAPAVPFDGGGDRWPDARPGTVQDCDGWSAVRRDGHLYLWTAAPA